MPSTHARILTTTALMLAACSGTTATPAPPTPTTPGSSTPAAATIAPSAPTPGSSCDPIEISALIGRIVFDDGQDVWAVNADGTGSVRLTQEPWREFDPTLSPDGRLIVYRAEPEDYPELWIMNADGSGQRRLSPDGGFPSWSRDGSMLAYAPAGGDAGRSSIAIMNPDGSGSRSLPGTEFGEYPAWSPDGMLIAFSSANTGVRLMSIARVDGSGVVSLADVGEGSHNAWSPDGGSLLFASHRDHLDNYRDIYVMRPDGSDVRRLTHAAGETPAWSPDGRFILFSAAGGFGVMRSDGCGETRLPVAGVGFASFPDWR
jgi:TolB protein